MDIARWTPTRFGRYLAASLAVTTSITHHAASEVNHWANANLRVPNTIDGLYINVEARTTGSAGAEVAGWDINPYNATSLTWFNATGTGMMRFPGVTTGSAGSLALNASVDSAASYGSGAVVVGTAAGNWRLNSLNYFGFRFVAASGSTHYGWGSFRIGASISGPDRVITELAWETTAGAPIRVGDTGMRLPSGLVQLPESIAGTAPNDPGPIRMFAAGGELWALVGMPFTDPSEVVDAGQVRVVRFTRTGGRVESDLLAPSPSVGGKFGMGIGTDGTTLVVMSSGSGAVHLFRREGLSFSLVQTLTGLFTPGWGTCFPAVAGNRIVIPDPAADSGRGRILVLASNGGPWSVTNILSAPSPIVNRGFGGGMYATAQRIVGSEFTNPPAGCTGRVFEFDMNNLAAPPIQFPAPTGMSGCSLFGTGVSGTDTVAAVRARDDSANGSTSGSVVLYERSASGWAQVLRAGPVVSSSNREWGFGAVEGGRILAGAEAPYCPGSVFDRAPSGWFVSSTLGLPAPQTGAMRHGAMYRDTILVPVQDGSACRMHVYALRDCNFNGLGDDSEVAGGLSQDANANGVPDLCECTISPGLPSCCIGNLNADLVVDGSDLGVLLASWGPCAATCVADLNADAVVNGADLGIMLNVWGACPP